MPATASVSSEPATAPKLLGLDAQLPVTPCAPRQDAAFSTSVAASVKTATAVSGGADRSDWWQSDSRPAPDIGKNYSTNEFKVIDGFHTLLFLFYCAWHHQRLSRPRF